MKNKYHGVKIKAMSDEKFAMIRPYILKANIPKDIPIKSNSCGPAVYVKGTAQLLQQDLIDYGVAFVTKDGERIPPENVTYMKHELECGPLYFDEVSKRKKEDVVKDES